MSIPNLLLGGSFDVKCMKFYATFSSFIKINNQMEWTFSYSPVSRKL